MDWLERYLQAVRKHLPWQRQDDIIAELRANLESQLEERQHELGRPLTEGEILGWLKELGPPLQMASRYHAPRYLIGPALFPFYFQVLRLVVLVATAAYVLSIVVRLFVETHDSSWAAGQIAAWPQVLILSAGWVTAAFAALQFISERYPEKCPDFAAVTPHWSPAGLPPLAKKQPPAGSRPRSFAGAVAEFIVHVAMVIWLLLIPGNPWLMLGPAAAYLHNSPVLLLPVLLWFYWAVVFVNAVRAVWFGYLLLAEEWRFRTTAQHLITKAIEIVPTLILIAAPGHQYVIARPGAGPLPGGFSLDALNHYIWFACAVVGAIVAIQFLVELVKTAIRPRGSSVTAFF
jgi:hypothetical protein